MSRVMPVGARENHTAKEVADLFDLFWEDRHISEEEARRLEAAHDRNCDAADVTEKALRVVSCVVEAGTESRQSRMHLREWTVITGEPILPDAA